jgi:hypothetical protein
MRISYQQKKKEAKKKIVNKTVNIENNSKELFPDINSMNNNNVTHLNQLSIYC